ncbi:hypothetical protein L21SP2_2992 [Salinispira pacifica]|uniref:Uncharacterized protein n=1 Tax=Salinispira pacifica TaxID=1307761 RepID=V5WKR0_9SPIO|nr:hypothetical protein L21SP2_2992 [Salinispira pacifica]
MKGRVEGSLLDAGDWRPNPASPIIQKGRSFGVGLFWYILNESGFEALNRRENLER